MSTEQNITEEQTSKSVAVEVVGLALFSNPIQEENDGAEQHGSN